LGERFIQRRQPTLEAQIANLADEIAYNNHDLDDGLRAGILTLEELKQVPLFKRQYDIVMATHPSLTGRRLVHEIVRRMIAYVVTDLIETTAAQLRAAAPPDVDAVRGAPGPLVKFSEPVMAEHKELKRYLLDHVYRHYRVLRMTNKANAVISSLFETFFTHPELLPPEHLQTVTQMEAKAGESGRARAVADYIAGMTDRYAIVEHERIFDPAKRS
jgi:dGTPase